MTSSTDRSAVLLGYSRQELTPKEWESLAEQTVGFVMWATEPIEAIRRYAVVSEPHFRWRLLEAKIGGGSKTIFECAGAFYSDEPSDTPKSRRIAAQRAAEGARLHQNKSQDLWLRLGI